ncbi:hypothetical protein EGR_05414 [Echinococcus granulosus]|uniref:Uncharacterized protein n=1 Tax=Echinococcus granulosus TaxID=6210 RepID=W6V1N8_ECHGR|nr:hypothetical protein EGR_05414 [Echinococcus granulosus]EUB59794.1 hypothetical protein EGR_05414 [Echinococcus granulosus]
MRSTIAFMNLKSFFTTFLRRHFPNETTRHVPPEMLLKNVLKENKWNLGDLCKPTSILDMCSSAKTPHFIVSHEAYYQLALAFASIATCNLSSSLVTLSEHSSIICIEICKQLAVASFLHLLKESDFLIFANSLAMKWKHITFSYYSNSERIRIGKVCINGILPSFKQLISKTSSASYIPQSGYFAYDKMGYYPLSFCSSKRGLFSVSSFWLKFILQIILFKHEVFTIFNKNVTVENVRNGNLYVTSLVYFKSKAVVELSLTTLKNKLQRAQIKPHKRN